MTKRDIMRLGLAERICYGFRAGERPIYLAPANRNVFLFMMRCSDIPRHRAIRLWALYCFVRDGDSIGPDSKSCDMIRSGVPEFSKSSDKNIKKALEELSSYGLLYETRTSRVLPQAPNQLG